MKLQELMQLCFNAGRESGKDPDSEHWRPWWEIYGRERHDAFLDHSDPDEPLSGGKGDEGEPGGESEEGGERS